MKFGKYNILFLLFFLLIPGAGFSQYKKGLSYYEHNSYFKAIPLLKKAAQKNNSNTVDAAVKLADCYRALKNYGAAEVYYKRAIELGNNDPQIHYNYGTVLKNNSHYDEALHEFIIYIKQKPDDDKAKNAIKSCNEIRTWQAKPKEYDVYPVAGINTARSEFCPVVFENKLAFVSERNRDLVNYESNDYNGEAYLDVFLTGLKNNGVSGGIKPFSKNINSKNHNGPVCFSADFNTLYLTRVEYNIDKKNKDFINRAKIFTAVRTGKSWGKAVPFEFNSNDYSVAYPTVSADGKRLFFASDMPGGHGGMDIYVCQREGNGWDFPTNLGPQINTSGNEVYPYIRKDSTLFFSSDGLSGFGGLDIFSAKFSVDQWNLIRNEGLGINSFTDDFGIYFTSDSAGYLSSNRDGGMGTDDIYQFKFSNKYITLDGVVLNSNNIKDIAKHTKLLLLDAFGNYLAYVRTDENGYFAFKNLDADKKYMVKIDENDPGYEDQKRFYYAEKEGIVMLVTGTNDKGEKFVFRNLPLDENALPHLEVYDETNISIGGSLLYGEKTLAPVANTPIVLKDDRGTVVQEVSTNAFGAFLFNNLPADDKYRIELAGEKSPIPAGSRVVLTNTEGKELKSVRADENGMFQFKLLEADKNVLPELEVEDTDLSMSVKGELLDQQKQQIPGVKIYLGDHKGNVIDSVLTDHQSKFEFKRLNSNKDYMLSVDGKDEKIAGMNKLYITSNNGHKEKEITRDENGQFTLKILKADHNELTELYVDDPWLEVLNLKNNENKEITITENVYYASGEYNVQEEGRAVLDKIIQIMQSNPNLSIEIISHTDSKAADKFNMLLSQKRARTAVEYMVSKGIGKNRLKATGMGESRLMNHCKNGVNCSNEEHAKNRRTEFKVVHKE